MMCTSAVPPRILASEIFEVTDRMSTPHASRLIKQFWHCIDALLDDLMNMLRMTVLILRDSDGESLMIARIEYAYSHSTASTSDDVTMLTACGPDPHQPQK